MSRIGGVRKWRVESLKGIRFYRVLSFMVRDFVFFPKRNEHILHFIFSFPIRYEQILKNYKQEKYIICFQYY